VIAMARKKTPKKQPESRFEKSELIAFLVIFIIFATAAYYFFNTESLEKRNVVATVNDIPITQDELQWWYKLTVLPPFQDDITMYSFLKDTLIPQLILQQEAHRQGIEADEQDAEQLLGAYLVEHGLSSQQFQDSLEKQGFSLEDVKKSFKVKATILMLFSKEGISFTVYKGMIIFKDPLASQEYSQSLVDNAEVVIFEPQLDALLLKFFSKTTACSEQPILFTTSSCAGCDKSSNLFNGMLKISFKEREEWQLDKGDNRITDALEKGVPAEKIELFRHNNPGRAVPVTIFSCYQGIGSLEGHEIELRYLMEKMVKN